MGEQKRKGKKHFRSKRSKSSVTTVIVIICIVMIGVVDYVSRSKNSPLTQFDPARTKGNESASVRILEFIDFQCPECAKGSQVIDTYMDQNPGKIFLTIKYYPLGELNSMVSALYGQCAAEQDNFWPMARLLFSRQHRWRLQRDAKPVLNELAREAGLNVNEIVQCVAQDSIHQIVMSERMLGESHFVKSTPTYFINDEIVVGVKELRLALEDQFKGK